MILGDAHYALSTSGSTYARSAKLRGGSARRLGGRQTEYTYMGVGKSAQVCWMATNSSYDEKYYQPLYTILIETGNNH